MKLKKRSFFINNELYSIDVDTGLYTLINDNKTDTREVMTTVVPEPLSSNPFGTGGKTLVFRRFWKKKNNLKPAHKK